MADMYRYLLKYVGTYKVMAPYDEGTLDFPKGEDGEIDKSFDDLYIPCKKGGVLKHSYTDGLLVWFGGKLTTVKSAEKAIRERFPDVWMEVEYLDDDSNITFKDADLLKKVEKVIRPEKLKEKVSPFDSRYLPEKPKKTRKPRAKKEVVEKKAQPKVVEYKIPYLDYDKIYEATNGLERGAKTKLTRDVVNNFDKNIQKKMGKSFNIEQERGTLDKRSFIHKIGMWDEFLTELKKETKKVLG